MRTAEWQYTEWAQWNGTQLRPEWGVNAGVELYDHRNDDGYDFDATENINVANQNPEVVAALSKQLHELVAATWQLNQGRAQDQQHSDWRCYVLLGRRWWKSSDNRSWLVVMLLLLWFNLEAYIAMSGISVLSTGTCTGPSHFFFGRASPLCMYIVHCTRASGFWLLLLEVPFLFF
jgi:hypothetical protein